MKVHPANDIERKPIKNFRELVKRYEQFGDKVAFKYKEAKEVKEITYKKFAEDIKAMAEALISINAKRVAVIGNNRYEWCVTYLGTETAGKVIVPLDKALTDIEIEKLLKRSEVDVVVYEKKYSTAISNVIDQGLQIKYKICMDNIKDNNIIQFGDFVEKGKKIFKSNKKKYNKITINNNEMYIMLFTSGTTNEPKAVMLSQNNICSNISAIAKHVKLYKTDTLLSFLPIHHTFECTITFLYGTYSGSTIAFCEGLRHIADNLKEFQVSVFVAVPLVLETMYKKIQKGIAESGKENLINKLKGFSNFLLKHHIDARKFLFKAVLKQFDEYLRVVLYGAAPMDKVTIEGYNSLGIDLVQGYGLTETSPVITAESDERKKPGSVGIPLCNLEVKIVEPDKDGIGEIAAKGPSIMLGYYENKEATKKVLKKGWFYTGDYGYIDKDGFLYVTGRKSDIIVLRNGKNIYPQELEFLINKINYIDESLVYAREKDITDTLLCAKIIYNKDAIIKELGEKTNEEYKKIIWEEIKKINRELPTYKHIKEILITDEPLDKTTTHKVKRYQEINKLEKIK